MDQSLSARRIDKDVNGVVPYRVESKGLNPPRPGQHFDIAIARGNMSV